MKTIKIVDIVILSVIGIVCAIYAVSGLFPNNASPNYVLIACLLLFALVSHFILSISTELQLFKKQDELIKTINSLDAIKGVQIFTNSTDSDTYIAERITLAKESVCDLNWQDDLPVNPRARDPRKKQFTEKEIDKSIKSFCKKSSTMYREIFTFEYSANVQKMKAHIEYGDTYNCSYFENKDIPKFPKIQFVIIDEKEVIFASSAYEPYLYAVRDEKFVHMFKAYFEQAWRQSTKIKERKTVHDNIIAEIETKYTA